MFSSLTDLLGHVPPAAAYAILAAALLVESNVVAGVFVPTLTMMLTAGALSAAGYLDLPVVVVVAALSVVVADQIGHRTGRLLGGRLRTGRLGRRIPDAAWRRADAVMDRHGGRAIFVGRFFVVLRSLMPHLAGATGLRYRQIAPYSVAAAVVWSVLEAGLGFVAARSVDRIAVVGGPVLALIAAVAALVVTVLRRRARRRPTAEQARATTGRSVAPANVSPLVARDRASGGTRPVTPRTGPNRGPGAPTRATTPRQAPTRPRTHR